MESLVATVCWHQAYLAGQRFATRGKFETTPGSRGSVNIWTLLVVTTFAFGTQKVEARGAVKHSEMHRTVPITIIQLKVSTVLRLRNPAISTVLLLEVLRMRRHMERIILFKVP